MQSGCPSDWSFQLQRCEAGFFHSPLGIQTAAPLGEPLFAQLLRGEEVVGVAAGVRSGCRLSFRRCHYYFPTLPALADLHHPDEVLFALVRVLRSHGAAEVIFESFDARWEPRMTTRRTRPRQEYVVSLEIPLSEQAARLGTTHRRHLRRGVKEGWTVRLLHGEDARALLQEVPGAATRSPAPALTADWGTEVYSAWHGATPLAAVLVGWANRRAYHVLSGSTAEGYRRSASAWLHWRIMGCLAEHGFTTYNLGGTPASADRPQDPAHGLFRFKTGFGSKVVRCRGAQWIFGRAHAGAHEVAAWARDRFTTLQHFAGGGVP